MFDFMKTAFVIYFGTDPDIFQLSEIKVTPQRPASHKNITLLQFLQSNSDNCCNVEDS